MVLPGGLGCESVAWTSSFGSCPDQTVGVHRFCLCPLGPGRGRLLGSLWLLCTGGGFLSGCVLWVYSLSIGLSSVGVIVCRLVPGKRCYLCLRELPSEFAQCALMGSFLKCLLPGLGSGQVMWFHSPTTTLVLGSPTWTYQDGPQAQVSSTLCESPFQLPPTPPSWLLSVRLRPEQPLRTPARVGATASISLLNYAGAVVGRSTLVGPG